MYCVFFLGDVWIIWFLSVFLSVCSVIILTNLHNSCLFLKIHSNSVIWVNNKNKGFMLLNTFRNWFKKGFTNEDQTASPVAFDLLVVDKIIVSWYHHGKLKLNLWISPQMNIYVQWFLQHEIILKLRNEVLKVNTVEVYTAGHTQAHTPQQNTQ